MNYSPPKTFLRFGTVKKNTWRLGSFVIEPMNNQYGSEHYWITSSENESGTFTTSYYHNINDVTQSPEFQTEPQAIRWLESQLRALTMIKISEANAKLRAQIKNNLKWIKKLK